MYKHLIPCISHTIWVEWKDNNQTNENCFAAGQTKLNTRIVCLVADHAKNRTSFKSTSGQYLNEKTEMIKEKMHSQQR